MQICFFFAGPLSLSPVFAGCERLLCNKRYFFFPPRALLYCGEGRRQDGLEYLNDLNDKLEPVSLLPQLLIFFGGTMPPENISIISCGQDQLTSRVLLTRTTTTKLCLFDRQATADISEMVGSNRHKTLSDLTAIRWFGWVLGMGWQFGAHARDEFRITLVCDSLTLFQVYQSIFPRPFQGLTQVQKYACVCAPSLSKPIARHFSQSPKHRGHDRKVDQRGMTSNLRLPLSPQHNLICKIFTPPRPCMSIAPRTQVHG